MIKKIVKLGNIGRFRSFATKGDIQFKRMNLIFSENGRGKTTLTNIFRSLNEQNSDYVKGRKTLGSSGDQLIELISEEGLIKYKDGSWSMKPTFQIEIFDSMYVSDNVFSGYIIEHDQKKNLYLFTIGKQGVEYANKLMDVDSELRKLNTSIKALEQEIMKDVEGVVSISDFVKYKEIPNIDEEILKNEQALHSVEKESEIKAKPICSPISLPSFDKFKFSDRIKSSVDNLLTSAENLTKNHIQERLDQSGEKWLEYGVNKLLNDTCPFCKQDVREVEIVTAFKAYFSEEYKKLKKDIDELEFAFLKVFNYEKLFAVQSTVARNIDLIAYWKHYVSYSQEIHFDIEFVNAVWERFVQGIKEIIEFKKNNMLEKVELTTDIQLIIDEYLTVLDNINQYNTFINEINTLIEHKKSSIDSINVQNVKTRMTFLNNTKLRFDMHKMKLIDQYIDMKTMQNALNHSKKQLRSDLDQYTSTIFQKYEHRINYHLKNCGANFKISDYKSSFVGGKPSSDFIININGVKVNIGNDKSSITTPSFKNTLSDGDKSSLAFAFFLAKLETDPEISNKIILFDDPISSLDNHRKNYTADQILRFANLSKQVIVLTHDTYFARTIWQKFTEKSSLTQLCIKREGINDSKIELWNVDQETRTDYYHNYFALADFLEGNTNLDLKSIARCIRPLLEGNLRIRFPKYFKSDEWLGDFIKKVRNDPSLQFISTQLTDLEQINDYSKKYHHDKNPFADSEAINEIELMSYVERTLNVIKGVHNVS